MTDGKTEALRAELAAFAGRYYARYQALGREAEEKLVAEFGPPLMAAIKQLCRRYRLYYITEPCSGDFAFFLQATDEAVAPFITEGDDVAALLINVRAAEVRALGILLGAPVLYAKKLYGAHATTDYDPRKDDEGRAA